MGPTHEFEAEARRCGYRCIAGVDEAGRGPLAGPVVAAAVVLPSRCAIPGLNDSKLLPPALREELYGVIVARGLGVAIGWATAREIDRINILEATRLAVKRALRNLSRSLSLVPDFLLLDALRLPDLDLPQRPIVIGDRLSASVAAASIVAKVTRDRLMARYHQVYPRYNFRSHKGYGTPEHLRLLRRYGPSPLHRLTFEPVAEVRNLVDPGLHALAGSRFRCLRPAKPGAGSVARSVVDREYTSC